MITSSVLLDSNSEFPQFKYIHNKWEQANTNRDSKLTAKQRKDQTESARLQTREMVNPPKTQKLSKEKNPKGLNVCDDGVMWLVE